MIIGERKTAGSESIRRMRRGALNNAATGMEANIFRRRELGEETPRDSHARRRMGIDGEGDGRGDLRSRGGRRDGKNLGGGRGTIGEGVRNIRKIRRLGMQSRTRPSNRGAKIGGANIDRFGSISPLNKKRINDAIVEKGTTANDSARTENVSRT